MPITVIANIIAAPEHVAEVRTQLESLVAAAQQEAGTIQYVLLTNPADETAFWVTEVYEDQAAFDAHMGSETMATVMGAIGDKLGGPFGLHMLEPIAAKGLDI